MYTVKIHWERYEPGERHEEDGPRGEDRVVDETTLFLAADVVDVGAVITSMDTLKAWSEGQFQNYSVQYPNNPEHLRAKMIHITRGEEQTWYLASFAWLMGPDGKTIERLI